jgi:hypothetical protein
MSVTATSALAELAEVTEDIVNGVEAVAGVLLSGLGKLTQDGKD